MILTAPSLARLSGTAILLLSGACSTEHATYAPDGRKGYVIDCEGFLNSYGTCLIKAGRACQSRGYDILRGGPDDRSLLVACKAPK